MNGSWDMSISLVLQYRNTIILPVQIHPKAHMTRLNKVEQTLSILQQKYSLKFESSSQTRSFVRLTSQKMLNFLQK
jgi:hypothetical protein